MTAQAWLSWASFLLYCASSAMAFYYLSQKGERVRKAMFSLLGLGLTLHLLGFGARLAESWAYPENRWFMPVDSFYGALSFMSLALAFGFCVIEARQKLGILGAFIIPLSAASLGVAVLRADPAVAPLREELRSYWLNIHPMLLMAAYAAFANAFGVGLALLVQERQIKSRKPTGLCYRLPPIDELDALNGRIISVALTALVAGLVMGAAWAHRDWGRAWSWDAKQTMALVTALFYGQSLWLRYGAGQRGRRPVLVSMVGFVCLILTFVGAEMSAGRHDFLGGR